MLEPKFPFRCGPYDFISSVPKIPYRFTSSCRPCRSREGYDFRQQRTLKAPEGFCLRAHAQEGKEAGRQAGVHPCHGVIRPPFKVPD